MMLTMTVDQNVTCGHLPVCTECIMQHNLYWIRQVPGISRTDLASKNWHWRLIRLCRR